MALRGRFRNQFNSYRHRSSAFDLRNDSAAQGRDLVRQMGPICCIDRSERLWWCSAWLNPTLSALLGHYKFYRQAFLSRRLILVRHWSLLLSSFGMLWPLKRRTNGQGPNGYITSGSVREGHLQLCVRPFLEVVPENGVARLHRWPCFVKPETRLLVRVFCCSKFVVGQV